MSRSMLPEAWAVRTAVALSAIALVGFHAGCGVEPRTAVSDSGSVSWQPWHVIRAGSAQVLAFPEWLKELERYDVVYVGEEHYNTHHVDAAIRIMTGFLADGIEPVLGMEMFGWDGQQGLDEYLADPAMGTDQLLVRAQWSANWGGAFDPYGRLVSFARERRLRVYAMNPPKSLIRRVVTLGLAQARRIPEWSRWGWSEDEIVDDPAYRDRIMDQLRRCHGGGAEEDYRTMYEASMVRDEGMAKTLAAAWKERPTDRPRRSIVVSYTGGGHVQYGLPVPNRVARRLSGRVRQTSVYLTAYDEARHAEIQELLRERIADYVWLTPPGDQGPVRRCR